MKVEIGSESSYLCLTPSESLSVESSRKEMWAARPVSAVVFGDVGTGNMLANETSEVSDHLL